MNEFARFFNCDFLSFQFLPQAVLPTRLQRVGFIGAMFSTFVVGKAANFRHSSILFV